MPVPVDYIGIQGWHNRQHGEIRYAVGRVINSHLLQRNRRVANPQLSLAVSSQERRSGNRKSVNDRSLAQLQV